MTDKMCAMILAIACLPKIIAKLLNFLTYVAIEQTLGDFLWKIFST